jgi:purine-binding chemotaxis protein CheW
LAAASTLAADSLAREGDIVLRSRIQLLQPGDALGSLPVADFDVTGAMLAGEGFESHDGAQYIGFRIHTEAFLLSVAPVQEIIMMCPVTFVPGSHFSVEGIISLRGEIMPILNLRRLLGFPKGGVTQSTRIMIVSSEFGGFGIIVDAITQFVRLKESEIESIAQNFFSHEYKILTGVAKEGSLVRGILDVGKLMQVFARVHDAATDEQEEEEDADTHTH